MGSYRLAGHLIVINYPGQEKVVRLLDELRSDVAFGSGLEIVLIDEDLEELPAALARRGVRFVRGNPTKDETLERAAVDQATHAIVLSRKPGDAHSDNMAVAVVLAIEARRPEIITTVECVDADAEELLRKAGTDRIVCMARFDAHFLTSELLHPGAQEFVDNLLSPRSDQFLSFAPIRVDASASFKDVAVRCRKRGHLALGVRRAGKNYLNVSDEFTVQEPDEVISMGEARLGELAI